MHPSLVAVLRGGIGLERSLNRFCINTGLATKRSDSALFRVHTWECAHTMALVASTNATAIVAGQGKASRNGGVVDWFGKSDYTTKVV